MKTLLREDLLLLCRNLLDISSFWVLDDISSALDD